jgi:hypothetical protein
MKFPIFANRSSTRRVRAWTRRGDGAAPGCYAQAGADRSRSRSASELACAQVLSGTRTKSALGLASFLAQPLRTRHSAR